VGGVLIISFSAIFVRLAGVAPTTSAFFRASYALPFLLALWLWRRGPRRRPPRDRLLAVAAGVFLGLDLAFWHRAIDLIGAGLATVLGNTQVVFVGLLAWAIHGERPSRGAGVAISAVLAGVVLISGVGTTGAYGQDPRLGVFLGLLTAMTYSIFLLGLRAASRGLGAPAGPILDATLGAVLGTVAVGAADGELDLAITWPAHGWLLALAVGSQVVGWQLIGAALPRLPALETSVFLLLQPMLTAVWAWLLFSELLSGVQIAGMVLVLAGVGWLSASGSAARPAPSTDRPRPGSTEPPS
jgi:drug/metabolite transporter (DMT)-like permease